MSFRSGNNRVFSILYQVCLIRQISRIQLKPVIHDWRLLKAFLSPTHSWLFSTMVMMPDWMISRLWVQASQRSLISEVFWHLISWIRIKRGKTQVWNSCYYCMEIRYNPIRKKTSNFLSSVYSSKYRALFETNMCLLPVFVFESKTMTNVTFFWSNVTCFRGGDYCFFLLDSFLITWPGSQKLSWSKNVIFATEKCNICHQKCNIPHGFSCKS